MIQLWNVAKFYFILVGVWWVSWGAVLQLARLEGSLCGLLFCLDKEGIWLALMLLEYYVGNIISFLSEFELIK